MEISGAEIAIVGAGIGGLAMARALALRGAHVTVFEQAETISEVGAGIQIGPNGFAVLRALGLDAEIAARSMAAQAINLLDDRGKPVVRLDLSARFADRYHFVHRADLIAVLEQGARDVGVQLVLGARITDVTDHDQAPYLTLADGTMRTADLIIGADGLHSQVRTHLNRDPDPFFTGQIAWRALVPLIEPLPPEVRLFMGPHRHLVCYPLRGGTLLNIVAAEDREGWVPEGWSHQDDPENLRAAFAGFCPEVVQILERVQEVHLWGLFRHKVAPRWHGKRLALLGDAVHPTLPFLAQGASMALEDVWVLAECLSSGQGLEAYQARRVKRVRKVVDAATGNAWKYHLSFPPLRWAAHTGLRMLSRIRPEALVHQFDWIYEHDVTGEAGAENI